MKFLIKESNFKQIVMSTQFEHLEQSLMVEIIRRHQSPAKVQLQADQISNILDSSSHDKCKKKAISLLTITHFYTHTLVNFRSNT